MIISDKQLNKIKSIPCSIDSAWWKWTTHEGLMSFFGIDNKIELIPGGSFEIYFLMDNLAGLRGSEGCKVLSFLPKQMFSFSWNAPPQYKDIRESSHHTWVVINFTTISEHETEITLTHTGWPDDEKWDPVYNYFDKAWESVITMLYDSCAI
jgi:Activator of Hsp90 ATPase homolog 1-like protein